MPTSLERVLRPRSVAIVGATADPTKFGGKVLGYLAKHGYTGTVLPINPKYEDLLGWRCYPAVSAVPDGPVDLVLVAVPREQVVAVLRDAGARGAAAAVIFTSGFREADERGWALEAEVLDVRRKTGLRLLGPNAFGFINFADRVTATPAITLRYGDLCPGPVALISHSGGMAMASIYARARERGVHWSYIICPGNEVDLELSDFLEYLIDDEATRVIALVIEGIRDGARFRRALARTRECGKPVVALKIGRSELGREIALSHTGHLSGADEIFQAVAAQHGVIRVDDYDELYLTAGLLAAVTPAHRARLARRADMALISISGGIASVTGDLAGLRGLSMATLAPATAEAFRPLLPDFQAPTNPVDVGAMALARPAVVGEAIAALRCDPGVDIIVPALTLAESYDGVLGAIVAHVGGDQLMPVLWAGGSFGGRGASILHDAGVPYFDAPSDLVTALDRLVAHCRAWAAPVERGDAVRAGVGEEVLRDSRWIAGARSAGRTVLNEHESKALLRELGFPVPRGTVARTEAEALATAESLGFPVVLKLVSADLPHKSEHGIVILNVRSGDDLMAEFRRLSVIADGLRARVDGVLVEEMIGDAVEAVVGFRVDPQFGPVVMVGSGGVLVELLRDVAFLVPPFGVGDARRAIASTRGLDTLLRGYRGSPPADREALVDVVVRLGRLAPSLASVAVEAEINPLLVRRGGTGAAVVDALVKLRA